MAPPVKTAAAESADDAKLAELLTTMAPEDLMTRVRAARVAKTVAYFGKHLVDQSGASSISLTVTDWRSIDLFFMEKQTAEFTPGGDVFEHVVGDAITAIANRDADRLIGDLLLILKAVRRD